MADPIPLGADAARQQTAPAPPLTRPWLSHYSPGVPAEISIPERSLPEMLDAAAQQYGPRDAIIYYGTRISFVQLHALVDRFAQALVRLGVRHGDRVALVLPNVPQLPIAFYGALKAGAVVVPTNPIYTPPELRHQLTDAGVRILVTLDMLYPNLAAVRAETPVEQVILAGVADYFPSFLAMAYRLRQARESRHQAHVDWHAVRADPTVHRFKDLLGAAHGRRGFEVFALPAPAAPDDLALLQYTGGTTGVAKGAMLTHRNLVANALQAWAWSEQSANDHHLALLVAPCFHSYGLTVGMNLSLFNGCGVIMLPRFTAKDCLAAIKRYKPDMFPGVPTMYLAIAREAEQKRIKLSSIKVCISGAAPLPGEVQARFERLSGARLVEGYGLSEASPVTHCNPVFGDRRIGTIGLPVPSTEAAILDQETLQPLPPGEIGEIAVRGPQVMLGYWQRPDETAKVIRDGWLLTGDLGTMDEDGYFRVADRAKDLIIAGGYNIYPREVEEVLYQHPKVLEACVVGIPDAYRGETVRAYIVVKPGETLTAQELTDFCKERLAAYKVPKQFVFRDSLPKSLIGKVLRRQLRDEAIAELAAAQQPAAGQGTAGS
jgi:long-chain acyl-CoA synthetase